MSEATQVDILRPNGGNGSPMAMGDVAARLMAANFNVNALRTNEVLSKDEWKMFDDKVVEIARQRLVGVADLLNAGLRFDIPNPMGITQVEWEKISDMSEADVDMSGVTEGRRDRVLYELASVPLPIIHKDFQIGIRALSASRNRGTPLDTTQAALAARLVSEKIEYILFNGHTIAGTNGTIYGYLNAPNKNTGSVTATWLTATGAQILADVLAMVGKAVADHMYGPYMIYVPTAVYVHLGDDFKAESDKTILQRIKEVPGIRDIRPTENLTAPNVLLVQFTSDVVDMGVGQQPTTVQWSSHGGMLMHFKVLSLMVPRFKSDYANQSGVVHYS